MIVLCFSMQGEDIFERTNGKCHFVYTVICKRTIFLSMQMVGVAFVQFSQLVDDCVT